MSEKVAVFDTTLRDGEQAAGTRLGSREKLIIASQLANLNVDVIEAGYPASSPEDFEAVQLIAREVAGPAICALSRAVPSDIEACGKALANCRAAADPHRDRRVGHPHHRQVPRRAIRPGPRRKAAARSCEWPSMPSSWRASLSDDVEFYAEDAGRAEPRLSCTKCWRP